MGEQSWQVRESFEMLDDAHPVTQHHIREEWIPEYDSMFSAV